MVRNLDMRQLALRMAVPSLLVAALMVFVVAQLGGGSREVADAQAVPSGVDDASSAPGVSAVGLGQVQAAGAPGYSLSALKARAWPSIAGSTASRSTLEAPKNPAMPSV